MGWEASEQVAYVYDGAGLLVGSRVTRDCEWDARQRSLVLASIDLENSTDENGVPSWDALNPTAEDPDGEFRWEMDVQTNYVSRARAAADKRWRAEHGADADMSGIKFVPRKVLAREA